MKKIFILFTVFIIGHTVNSQQIFTITSAGFTFNPSSIVVSQGDIVRFNVGASHPVVQVSQSTWSANGNTPLPGGFSFPSGSGDYNASIPGTFYYVCSDHIGSGMKGTITVSGVSGIEDTHLGNEFKIFPNPANDYIIVQCNSNLSDLEIRIFDVIGRDIKVVVNHEGSEGQFRIDIGHFIKGLYYLKVNSGKRTSTLKFMKA